MNVAWWPLGAPANSQGADLTGEAVPPVRFGGAVLALAVAVEWSTSLAGGGQFVCLPCEASADIVSSIVCGQILNTERCMVVVRSCGLRSTRSVSLVTNNQGFVQPLSDEHCCCMFGIIVQWLLMILSMSHRSGCGNESSSSLQCFGFPVL